MSNRKESLSDKVIKEGLLELRCEANENKESKQRMDVNQKEGPTGGKIIVIFYHVSSCCMPA